MPAESSIAVALDDDLSGLDRLEQAVPSGPSRWVRAWNAVWPKVAAVALLVLVWQVAVWREWKPEYLLPSPSTVWGRLVDDIGTSTLWRAVGTTMWRAVIGFAIAVAVGSLIGIVVVASRHVRSAVGSLLTGLQTMPSIAWFPLAILLLGLSEASIRFVVVLGAAPAIANGFISGIDATPPLLRRAGRSMGAGRAAMYRHFLVPGAMPSVVSGLKLGWAFAWRSLMAGELLVVIPGRQSLGTRLEFARELHDATGVLASMVVIAVIGVLLDSLVFSRVEQRVLRRRGLGAHTGR